VLDGGMQASGVSRCGDVEAGCEAEGYGRIEEEGSYDRFEEEGFYDHLEEDSGEEDSSCTRDSAHALLNGLRRHALLAPCIHGPSSRS